MSTPRSSSPNLRAPAPRTRRYGRCRVLRTLGLFSLMSSLLAASPLAPDVRNSPPDLSGDFADADNRFFLPGDVSAFDLATGWGSLVWKRHRLGGGMLFNHRTSHYKAVGPDEWPGGIYAADPALPFSVEGVDASTIRIRLASSATPARDGESPMLVREPGPDGSWKSEAVAGGWRYTGPCGSVFIGQKPWRIELRDPSGKLLTHSVGGRDIGAFGYVRRAADYSRSYSAAFALSPGEKSSAAASPSARSTRSVSVSRSRPPTPSAPRGRRCISPCPFS